MQNLDLSATKFLISMDLKKKYFYCFVLRFLACDHFSKSLRAGSLSQFADVNTQETLPVLV